MPSTPGDATRFTATGPYASAMPSFKAAPVGPSSTRIDFGEAPKNETPQQKIARLRAAVEKTRLSKEDRFDRVVRIGRVWADRAHKFTALSLLGLTVVSVLVATAGITDMLLHNRRRRRDWYAEQGLKRAADIVQAQQALVAGTITHDQLLLLGQERAKAEAAEAKASKPGMFKRAGSYLFGGLSKEEQKGGRLGAATVSPAVQEKLAYLRQATANVRQDTDNVQPTEVVRPVESITPVGGPLDRQAQHVYDATIQQGQTWRKWLIG